MKKITFILSLFIAGISFAQSVGDIAFIGFNADGEKDFAIVALADIPQTNPIFFMDGNLTATGKKDGSGEGMLKWERTTTISAGTVITFTDITKSDISSSASIGTLTEPDNGFDISGSGDAIFACIGDPTDTEVTTTWLAGIYNSDDGIGSIANFSSTGLTVGNTFILIDDTAHKDGGQYNGTRTGEDAAGYRALIANDENWITSTSDGEAILPFNTTSFNDTLLSAVSHKLTGVSVSITNGNVAVENAEVVAIYNVLGQQVFNGNLNEGIYLVQVKSGNKVDLLKVIAQ